MSRYRNHYPSPSSLRPWTQSDSQRVAAALPSITPSNLESRLKGASGKSENAAAKACYQRMKKNHPSRVWNALLSCVTEHSDLNLTDAAMLASYAYANVDFRTSPEQQVLQGLHHLAKRAQQLVDNPHDLKQVKPYSRRREEYSRRVYSREAIPRKYGDGDNELKIPIRTPQTWSEKPRTAYHSQDSETDAETDAGTDTGTDAETEEEDQEARARDAVPELSESDVENDVEKGQPTIPESTPPVTSVSVSGTEEATQNPSWWSRILRRI